MNNYKLIIFDLDGTLAEAWTDQLLPGVAEWFADNRARHHAMRYAIATNQGGVGLRHWMETEGFGEPEQYPTEQAVYDRIGSVLKQIHAIVDEVPTPAGGNAGFGWGLDFDVHVAFAYQTKKGAWSPAPEQVVSDGLITKAEWNPFRRKPAPMMLTDAMFNAGLWRNNVLMVGDSEDDRQAANYAGVDFMWADEFFGRTTDESV